MKMRLGNRRGCGLFGCAFTFLGLLCTVVMAVLISTVVFGAMKSSDAYTEALHQAQTHPDVVQALGEPVEADWWVSGSIELSGSGSGFADITIPISGSRDKGRIYAVATRREGVWDFSRLEVAVNDRSERIQLLSR